ncbi:MAG: hypothetical protein EHM33_01595 [Chloroflexi bacterium]|nr:MAG: hypothetical protein EHM33_01595 [Chloroflexota bacterium]
MNSPNEQAVLVYLDGKGLPKEIYKKYDLATLEDQLIEAIESQSLGEFDGNEVGPEEAVLYMYAPNAEALFAGIEPILTAYPLCQNGLVIVRQGGPGSPAREIRLPKA